MNNDIEARECQTCRSIGLVLAAMIVGLISFYVEKSYSITVAIIVFLVLLAIGMLIVNKFCGDAHLETSEPAKAKPNVHNVSDRPIAEPVLVTPKETDNEVPAEVPVVVEADPSPEVEETEPVETEDQGTAPATLSAARDGKADDLKKIKGVGPKLEKTLNSLGFYHFDQVANWTEDEITWVDSNLEGFKGRATRDDWMSQAKTLAAGGDTSFSKKVDKGDVY